jgi:amidase
VSDHLALLDATAQAELVRRGELAPGKLVEAALRRIERLDPLLNAVTTVLADEAPRQAGSAYLPAGPFRGVPLLLKDFFCHTAGDPYYEGARVLKELG